MDELDTGLAWDDIQPPLRRWASVSSSSSVSKSFSQHSFHYTRSSTSVESGIQLINRRNPSYSSRDSVLSPTGSDVTAGSDVTGSDITPAHEMDYWSQGGFDDLDSGMGSSNFDDADSGVGSSHYDDMADIGSNYSPISAPSHFKTVGYGVVSIKPQGLSKLLRSGMEKYLLIDCRSFLEYNTSHIQQSTNVCCSKLVKRRLQKDKVQIHDLLMQSCHIDIEEFVEVIVYDQCTENLSLLSDDNFLCVLLTKLCMTYKRVALLKGGFLAFQAMYPSLCESKTNSYRCTALTSLSQPCLPVSNVGPTRILPFLYLGSQQDALSPDIVQVNEITYVLNVSTTCMKPSYISEGHFLRIPVNDNYSARLQPYFNEAFQFLDKVREANGCCLVHCLAGISRSPTLAIAYIMKYLNMSSDDAYRYVKDKRPTISPNFNFLGQLLEFEKQIKRERELNNNTEGALALKSDSRLRSNYVMDLSCHSPSSPINKNARSFTFDSPESEDGNREKGKGSKRQQYKIDSNDKTQSIEQPFQRTSKVSGLTKAPLCIGALGIDNADPLSGFHSFPIKHESKVRPNVLNLGFEPSWKMQSAHTICKESTVSSMTSSLTEIKETKESETPSPVCSTSSETIVFSTSGVTYSTRSTKPLSTQMYGRRTLKPQSPLSHSDTHVKYSGRRAEMGFTAPFPRAGAARVIKDLPSPFPCGESTIRDLPSPFPCGESTVRDLPSPFPCGETTIRELPSPFPCGESTIKDLPSPFPCGESTVMDLLSPFPCGKPSDRNFQSPFPCGESYSQKVSTDQISSAVGPSVSGKSHTIDIVTSDMVSGSVNNVSNVDEMQSSESSLSQSKSTSCSQTSDGVSLSLSDSFLKSRGKRPLRSRLSLSLSPITPLRSTTKMASTSELNSGDYSGPTVIETCEPSACKIERKLSESVPNVSLFGCTNIPSASKSRITCSSSSYSLSSSSSSSSFSTTTSHSVKLKSFNLPSPTTPLSLPAQSPTSSLARLHFSSAENSDNETETLMDVNESNMPSTPGWFSSNAAFETLDRGLKMLSSFESTSLDKLNFTPCLSNSVENIQMSPCSSRSTSLKRPLHDSSGKDSNPSSPGSLNSSVTSSRNSTSPTASGGTTPKAVVRKREGRVKRTLVRPNSIAFSSYPTFDLGSDCQDSPHSSNSSASQDDSSASYSISGKKSKPSDYMNDVKFRLGRYSEREVYRQITAAMETAMLKTQVYEATRKSRSLDDILSSEDDSSAPNSPKMSRMSVPPPML